MQSNDRGNRKFELKYILTDFIEESPSCTTVKFKNFLDRWDRDGTLNSNLTIQLTTPSSLFSIMEKDTKYLVTICKY